MLDPGHVSHPLPPHRGSLHPLPVWPPTTRTNSKLSCAPSATPMAGRSRPGPRGSFPFLVPDPPPTPFSALRPNPGAPCTSKQQPNNPGPVPDPPRTKRGRPGTEPPGAPAELKADGSGSGTRAAAHLTARLPPAARPAPRVEFVGPPRPPCRTPASSSRAPVPRALQGSLGSAQGRRTHPGPQQPQPRTPNPRRVMRPGRTIRPARGGGARTARARPDAARRANPPQVQPTREGRVGPAA